MGWVGRIFMVSWLLCGAVHALYLGQGISAYRVPDGKIKVDGRPDSVWKEIGARSFGYSQIPFNNYGKIVILEPDSIRNAPPEEHYTAPSAGSVTMLAAYDASNLYFFFLVKENNRFNPRTLCGLTDLWKAHAVELFLDPSSWSETLYTAYFSADAIEASYGTSSKSVQVSKPAYPAETRLYYRDRTVGNRFETRTVTSQVAGAAASRTSADSLYIGVEIRISIAGSAYAAGRSAFISWGYNHYPEGARTNCDANPIAYRWAKHYKTYSGAAQKPPGWRAGDSTHFDPLRSWDGWGQLYLDPTQVTGAGCSQSGLAETDWELAIWRDKCGPPTTALHLLKPMDSRFSIAPASGLDFLRSGYRRDIRGRLSPQASTGLFILPAGVPMRRSVENATPGL